jgi:hypothetical protein
MTKKNILVFPCGSEIGLEIHRSLKYSTHFRLIGGSSVNDHGKFIYEQYIGDIPFHTAPNFINILKKIIIEHGINAIYPAMDAVAKTLKNNEYFLNCLIIGSSAETTSICASKKLTYQKLSAIIPTPQIYPFLAQVKAYPIFIKPDIGYGSRNVFLARNENSAQSFLNDKVDIGSFLLCEYLSGDEYTIDCFTDRHGILRFVGARKRTRISNGISVNTIQTNEYQDLFNGYAEEINATIELRGAWFFQMKLDQNQKPKLLEIAARLGGSSSLFRAQGINFALLSAFDAFDIDIKILKNKYDIELDRALSSCYKHSIKYSSIYIDLDDTLIVNNCINLQAISFIFQSINENKRVILITRHKEDLDATLKKHRLDNLFDEIIHLQKGEKKSTYITNVDAIFIDDSFAERLDVSNNCNIPTFDCSMIEVLIESFKNNQSGK